MKIEGLIKTISVKNFPHSLLQSALRCSFDIHGSEASANLLSTGNYLHSASVLADECKRIISSPLAGGLLTRTLSKTKDVRQLTSNEMKLFDTCCSCVGADISNKWLHYRGVIDVLSDVSFKHSATIESVSLRWLLQLNTNNMVVVGTDLGMDLEEEQGGLPYSRQRELRQVFSFSLDEEDMSRLNHVADMLKVVSPKNSLETSFSGCGIDFTDKSLWIGGSE